MRTAIYFFYGLDVEIRPKSGVPHHPPELFIHLGGAIGPIYLCKLEETPVKDEPEAEVPQWNLASSDEHCDLKNRRRVVGDVLAPTVDQRLVRKRRATHKRLAIVRSKVGHLPRGTDARFEGW